MSEPVKWDIDEESAVPKEIPRQIDECFIPCRYYENNICTVTNKHMFDHYREGKCPKGFWKRDSDPVFARIK